MAVQHGSPAAGKAKLRSLWAACASLQHAAGRCLEFPLIGATHSPRACTDRACVLAQKGILKLKRLLEQEPGESNFTPDLYMHLYTCAPSLARCSVLGAIAR